MKALLKPLSVTICSTFALFVAQPAISQATSQISPQPRITAPVDNSVRSTLAGSRPLRANPAHDIGAVSPDMKLEGMSIVLGRSAAQQAALNQLLANQQNPASPLYHHWLTPEQYAAQFGAAPADIATVETWLEQQGFAVDSVSRSRNRIFFSGTAAQVGSAFEAPLHYYRTPAIGDKPAETHFAPSTDLSIPSAFASSILSVDNLTDFRPHSHLKVHPAQVQSNFTVAGDQAYFLSPPDVETIYDVTPVLNQGYNGSGETIAVVGQSAVVTSDITTFQTLLGLTAKAPGINLVPGTGTSTIVSGDETESDIDLEYSSALAPGATVNFYYTGNMKNTGVFDSLQYVVDNDLAPIISISYGDCEFDTTAASISSFDSSVLSQAASQGETVIASAGDDGSTDCAEDTNLTFAQQTALAVDYPSSSPYVTGMGGTEFPAADVTPTNTTYWTSAGDSDVISSAISYIPEQVWNDDAADLAYEQTLPTSEQTNPIGAGGGGQSLYEVRPYWQTGVPGIPSGTTRLVPDLALAASPNYPGYVYCSSDKTAWSSGQTGSCVTGFYDQVGKELYYTIAGGTSFDAPIFSGLLAIINQVKGYTTGQGVINPTLYTLAANATTYASAFHDITSGGNECDISATYCGTGPQTTDYVSTTGYDEASGLGSIDFNNLLTAWTTSTTAPSTGTTNSTTTLTAATLTPANGADDTITITVASGSSASTTVPTGSVSVSVNGTVVNSDLPLTNGVASYTFSSTTAGSAVIAATYSGDTTYASSTGSITLTVAAAPTAASFGVKAGSVSVAAGASTTGTITITPANGYTGTVDLSVSDASLTDGCVILGSSSVSVTGTAAVTASYTVDTSSSACSTAGAVKLGSRKIAALHPASRMPNSPWKRLPIPATLAGTILFVCFRKRSRLLRAGIGLGLVLMLSFSGLGLTGCSGSSTTTTTKSTDTPSGTYTITVTGTDSKTATTTASTTFTVTVS